MKPKNFPERKRRRQLDAFLRGAPDAKSPGYAELRDVRTKKDRSNRAKLRTV